LSRFSIRAVPAQRDALAGDRRRDHVDVVVGLADAYPNVAYPRDFAAWGYDGMIEPSMVVSVEGCIGEAGGPDGVMLEEQLLITERWRSRAVRSSTPCRSEGRAGR
jgi:hypothetical protein